jgi:mono/diheme cytochrome c family protein
MSRFFAGFLVGLAVLPLLLLGSMAFGSRPAEATATPPAWEAKLPRFALDSSLSRRAVSLRNPIPATDPELLAGMRFYRNGCAGCHGDAGASSDWGTAGFYPRVPQFGKHPPDRPDWQMFRIVKHGIRYTGMGAWEKLASDREIWQVVTFLSHLRSLPANVETEWRKAPTSR